MDIHCDSDCRRGGGSTCAGMWVKYAPQLSVHVFDRERFPRDHIGESQLPPIGLILRELGCCKAVEAADSPIKSGGAGNLTRIFHHFSPERDAGNGQNAGFIGASRNERSIAEGSLAPVGRPPMARAPRNEADGCRSSFSTSC